MKLLLSSIVLVTLAFFAHKKMKEKFKEMKEKIKETNKTMKKYQKKYQELKKESDTRPCPDNVVLNDSNVREMLSVYFSDKEKNKCFNTSVVTDMNNLFLPTDFNADISSWDVSSVTNMYVSFHCS